MFFMSLFFLNLVVSLSLSVFLSLLFFLFSLSDTFKQKHISKSSERGTLLFLSLSLVLLPSFALYFSFLSHSLMSWFPSFSLFCVQCKHDLCLTRSHWTFMKLRVIDVYILNCLFFLSVRKGMCLNGIKCDCSFTAIHFFHRMSTFFSPKQALLPLGHVKCSDKFKRVVCGHITYYFPDWGALIV